MNTDRVTATVHDASSYAFNPPCWIAACKVDGRIVETAEFSTALEAIDWCEAQKHLRGTR